MGFREAQRILFDLLALAVNMATGFELSVGFKIHTCCVLTYLGVCTDFFSLRSIRITCSENARAAKANFFTYVARKSREGKIRPLTRTGILQVDKAAAQTVSFLNLHARAFQPQPL